MRECEYYHISSGAGKNAQEDIELECDLCPFHCKIINGHTGRCSVRGNHKGKLVAASYGAVAGVALDPIEKKPLYHFYPGSKILSIGSFGCNLTCSFCQNWQLSQDHPATRYWSPQEAAEHAVLAKTKGNIGLAFTYNEPLISFEYICDTAPLLHKLDLKVVLVTNGIIETEPLKELLPFVDAMNVDIKSIRPEFYRRLCGGDGLAARRTVEMAYEKCAVEVTNLIIPGENDSYEDLKDLVTWVASVSKQLPLHFSAYHPAWHLQTPATPETTLQQAYEIACEQLDYVYVGNMDVTGTSDTRCPHCQTLAIERLGITASLHTHDGHCPSCGEDLHIAQ